MMQILSYKYRLYPNKAQKEFLAQHFGCVRKIYNHFLSESGSDYQNYDQPWNRYRYQRQLPALKQQFAYLSDVNSQSLQVSLQNLDKAFKAFFKKRADYPQFKSKHYEQSFCIPQSTTVDFEAKTIFIPKLKTGIRCELHRAFEGQIKSSTITKNCQGQYYISITVERDIEQEIVSTLDAAKAIGIDVGLESFLTMSDGTKVDNPRWLKKAERRLKKLQRRLSKKIKGSANRNKARIKVAKQHAKVSNQRKDFQHKLSRKIVDDNQVSMIFAEDLNIRGMLKNSRLAKSISSVAWGQFLRFLEYKAHRKGKLFQKIGKFKASSKLCHVCGYKHDNLELSDRTWKCPKCDTVHDRDINAAINIRNIGLNTVGTTGIYACGEETSTIEPLILWQVTSPKQEAPQFIEG